MAMRPALKTIVDKIKAMPDPRETFHNEYLKRCVPNSGSISDYRKTNSATHKFFMKYGLKLRNPIQIKAGTKWTHKSNSGTVNGVFIEDCKIVAVAKFIGNQAILDKSCSIYVRCSNFLNDTCTKPEPDWAEQLAALDTELLEKIAKEI